MLLTLQVSVKLGSPLLVLQVTSSAPESHNDASWSRRTLFDAASKIVREFDSHITTVEIIVAFCDEASAFVGVLAAIVCVANSRPSWAFRTWTIKYLLRSPDISAT